MFLFHELLHLNCPTQLTHTYKKQQQQQQQKTYFLRCIFTIREYENLHKIRRRKIIIKDEEKKRRGKKSE